MQGGPPDRLGIMLLPDFSMGSLGALLDVFRALQEIEAPELQLDIIAAPNTLPDDWPIPLDSNALKPLPDRLPDSTRHWFVVGGPTTMPDTQHLLFRLLRRGIEHHCWCGIANGSLWLAAAGLLDGHEATINVPENSVLPYLQAVRLTARVVCVDRDRLTCLSNTAARDLGLAWVTQCYNAALANQVDNYLLAERTPTDQSPFLASRHLPDKLREANSLMHSNIQEPLNADELAALVHVSRRQLERWYREYFNSSPARYYLQLRLEQARHMLLTTHLSIADIAAAAGFSSPAHFATCYRKSFGQSPSAVRRR